ncbi:hypothetical protein EDEG_03545 [Edhazardia aedis USNM 41457]|uniref:Uncharacterized protein n=1 Tax=Edhazardia aedis (strain USNM 41457) TaxID=1003232 RepID=J8ZQL4_EDHAE|nr:hypothetical protein EDEG_03545 [Edhazardia aedis USNM 41457]|eukprot:EJW02003.1 hypothetical protein EDEG_03545 [Edhazardia aedis USNM 41457]
MYRLAFYFLVISGAELKNSQSRLEQITRDIIQFENSIYVNSRNIDALNDSYCDIYIHESIKAEINQEINDLLDKKNYLNCLSAEDCFIKYKKDKSILKTEIDFKIKQKTDQFYAQIKKFDQSCENRDAYERINLSLCEKINALKNERLTLQLFLRKNK